MTDFGVRGDYVWRSNISFSASVQYERWLFPVIQPNAEKPVSATIEISFQPQKLFQHSAQERQDLRPVREVDIEFRLGAGWLAT